MSTKAKFSLSEERMQKISDHIQKYSKPDTKLAIQTLLITVLIYFFTHIGFLHIVRRYIYFPTWLWVVIRAGAIVRAFIIFHDCCHSSFWANPKLNYWTGWLVSPFVWTPFQHWKNNHIHHHQIFGSSDVHDPSRTALFTRQQYDNFPLRKKIFWRIIRDPLVFFLFVPILQYVFEYRFRRGAPIVNVYFVVCLSSVYWLGGMEMLIPDLFACHGSMVLGFILFHLQHAVNPGYNVPKVEQTIPHSAIYGSTNLVVPFWYKWVTLGIEYHHVHHYSTKVACYNLQECHETAPPGLWKDIMIVDYTTSFRSFFHVMWNEKTERYESFPEYESLLAKLDN